MGDGCFVRNERTKLTATYLNGLAIAMIAVGGIAPVFNATNHVDALALPLALAVAICLFLSAALHLFARRPERAAAMNMAQFASLTIMPVGALMIGFFMLFITRKDRRSRDPQHKPD